MVGSKFALLCLAASSASVWAKDDACEVLTNESNHECYKNVMWAKTEGIRKDPQWYEEMPFLNVTAALEDFQYALAVGEESHGNGVKWNCSLPCSLTPEAQAHYDALLASAAAETTTAQPTEEPTETPTAPPSAAPTEESAATLPGDLTTAAPAEEATETTAAQSTVVPTAAPTVAPSEESAVPLPGDLTTAAPEEGEFTTTAAGSDGMDWYWYVLIALGLCCCLPLLGLACSAFICYESVSWIFEGTGKRAPKKKRATKSASPPAAAATMPAAPTPTMAPMPTPAQAYPVPTYQPMTYLAAPARSVAVAPAVYTTPQAVYTTPQGVPSAAYPAPPVAATPATQYFTMPVGR